MAGQLHKCRLEQALLSSSFRRSLGGGRVPHPSQDPKALCNVMLIFQSTHFSFRALCRARLTAGTGSCSAVAAKNPGLRWGHASLCPVTMSRAWSLHAGIKTPPWGCTTAVAGWTGEEQTSPPGSLCQEQGG